jgi:flagellar hook protein FlgE
LAFKPTGTTVAEGFDVGVKLPLKINTDQGSPTATSAVDMQLNLNGSAQVAITPFAYTTPGTAPYIPDPKTYTHTTSITTYDSLGNAHIVSTYFCKTAVPDEWDAYTFIDGRSLQPGVQEDVYAIPPVVATGSVALPAGTITSTPTRVTFDDKGHLLKVSPTATASDLAVSAAALSKINADKAVAAVETAKSTTIAATSRAKIATTQLATAISNATKAVVTDAATALKTANSNLAAATTRAEATAAALAAADPATDAATLATLTANDTSAQAKLLTATDAQAAADAYNTTVTGAIPAAVTPDPTITDPLLIAQAAQAAAQAEFDAVSAVVPGGVPVTVSLTSARSELTAATAAMTSAKSDEATATAVAALAVSDSATAAQIATDALTADADAAKAAAALGLPGVTRAANTKVDFGSIDVSAINPDIKVSPMTFSLDLAASTQFSTPFTVNDLKQNGLPVGNLTGVDVDKRGVVFAKYSNGFAKPIGQVALARFPSNQDLAKVGATTWLSTSESGAPIYGAGGDNNFGSIQSSAIENSNVDLSEQLVKLIVAQQAYQANSQTITTEKTLVETVLRI